MIQTKTDPRHSADASGTGTSRRVVIAGGGPVGMSAALELALHGIDSIILESRKRDQDFPPRSHFANARSMEHFRRWGIADSLRRLNPIGPEFKRDLRFVTRLGGFNIASYEKVCQWDVLPFASEPPEWAPNPAFERALRDKVEALGIEIRYEHSVTGFDQREDGVAVRYTSPQGDGEVFGAYLVGADGSRSVVRRELGIRMEGMADLIQASSWLVHAPTLKPHLLALGSAVYYWFLNEQRTSVMIFPEDSEGHYMFGYGPNPPGVDGNDWEAVKAQIYRDTGLEFPMEPLAGGSFGVHSLMAPNFVNGRVLIAGDAAHLISPFGGFGMNIGIGDAADLGWKLAAVLNGWGGEKLLASYTDERREAEAWLLQLCIENTMMIGPELSRPGMEEDSPAGAQVRAELGEIIMSEKSKQFLSFGGQLGYQYRQSPIVADDGSEFPPLSMTHYVPSARPGCRAPHRWLADGSSLFDHFGKGFTVLRLDASLSTAGLEAAAAARGVPLKVLTLEDGELLGLYEQPLALIRPDQHVAWRGSNEPADSAALLDLVRGA